MWTEQQTKALIEALKTCQAELVTLVARLPESYAKNVRAALDEATAALKQAEVSHE